MYKLNSKLANFNFILFYSTIKLSNLQTKLQIRNLIYVLFNSTILNFSLDENVVCQQICEIEKHTGGDIPDGQYMGNAKISEYKRQISVKSNIKNVL